MKLIEIGKIGKPFGTEGLLRSYIQPRYLADFLASTVLFVKINGQAVPFFIEATEGDAQEVQVQIEEIKEREAALPLAGKALFLRQEDLQYATEKEVELSQYEHWQGFRLKDQTQGDIGLIESFLELPQQLMAIVNYQGKEIMIPFQEALVVAINPSDQTVLMDLPEGLLDL